MNWISSEGGPLALVAMPDVAGWCGIDGTDYQKACLVEDYFGLIETESCQQAIIFGSDPCLTAITSSASLECLVVRWIYADSRSSVEEIVRNLDDDVFSDPIETTSVSITQSNHLLFDSAWSGQAATGIEIDIPVGRYKVKTVVYDPDDRTSLILHLFDRKYSA